MHSEAAPHMPRPYSLGERVADATVHALGLIGAIVGGVVLIVLAASRVGPDAVTAAAIYIGGLLAMFLCSGIYNQCRASRFAGLLQGFDHSAIFLMIAGSYTPFCVLILPPSWSVALMVSVWSLAAIGIGARLFAPRVFARIGVGLYLCLGWLGALAVAPLMGRLDAATLWLLLAGGVIYSAGVVFHLWQRLPFQNAIWHGFVLAGASLHYFAVVKGIDVAAEAARIATG